MPDNRGDGFRTPGYVVVEGPIGVGKTSLAKRLAKSLGSELVAERPAENPFLERFYESPRHFALPAQLFFLFQRARQLKELSQGDIFSPRQVADFMLEKDVLFAQVNLDDDEYRLYQQVYMSLSPQIPEPDLVVFLQAPVNVLEERIQRRGVDYEQAIDREYLEKLVDAYSRFFLNYHMAPLLMVNAAKINFVDTDRDYNALLEQILKIKSGRHFFNPMVAA